MIVTVSATLQCQVLEMREKLLWSLEVMVKEGVCKKWSSSEKTAERLLCSSILSTSDLISRSVPQRGYFGHFMIFLHRILASLLFRSYKFALFIAGWNQSQGVRSFQGPKITHPLQPLSSSSKSLFTEKYWYKQTLILKTNCLLDNNRGENSIIED